MNKSKKLFKHFIYFSLLCSIATNLTSCETPLEIDFNKISIELTTNQKQTTLTWDELKNVHYSIYRAESNYGDYKLIKKDLNVSTFSDEHRGGHYKIIAYDKNGNELHTFNPISEENKLFGDNVYIFSPEDSAKKVNQIIDEVYAKQYLEEFSSDRYAFLFKEGTYDSSINLKVSYYTTMQGLTASPKDVKINSLKTTNGSNKNALINFWRGVENLSFQNDVTWAVSQATFLRNVKINGNLTLHDNGGYASGGFISNSYVSGTIYSGSQQQWLTRDTYFKDWQGQVWNMVFSGVSNAPDGMYPADRYTVIDTTPKIKEKPYLILDEYGYRIANPKLKNNSIGCDWINNDPDVTYIDTENIYFAKAETDNSNTINSAISQNKHIVFTPGIYSLDEPIIVNKNDTILLGMGLATLTPTNGNACMIVKDCQNVDISGLLFDTNTTHSSSLVDIGTNSDNNTSNIYLHDCFYRVGGYLEESTSVETCLNIYADDVICDNMWLWRADHGNGVGWDINNGDFGLQVYGDNVSCYGLFSEHFKKNNVKWHGNNGRVIFYQSEIAYDVPSQDRWMDENRLGYSSFNIIDSVTSFKGDGMGVYSHFYNGDIILESALQVPQGENININHVVAVAISKGVMNNIINDQGGKIDKNYGIRYLTSYDSMKGDDLNEE